jgi:uncharacterized protein YbaA (DUF1428 family)
MRAPRSPADNLWDPRLKGMMEGKDMPFDGKRMIYGGFETLVSLDA